jgi:hypothetical protein
LELISTTSSSRSSDSGVDRRGDDTSAGGVLGGTNRRVACQQTSPEVSGSVIPAVDATSRHADTSGFARRRSKILA